MQAIRAVAVVLMTLTAAALQGCPDHNQDHVAAPPGNKTFYKCTACLTDDPARCATHTPVCGDSQERMPSESAAKYPLCDTLSAAELARRPTPEGFKPSPYLKNACYDWPDNAFKTSCTTFTTTCESVPIH